MGKRRPANYKLKKQRAFLFKLQKGLCYWCNQPMILFIGHVKHPPDNQCTLDHLEDRLDPMRGKFAGKYRHVAACKKCNEDRSNARVKLLPKEELHERSNRHI